MSDEELAEDTLPLARGGRRHQPVERLWDDDGFRERLIDLCKLRGVKLSTVLTAAGTSPAYMEPSPNGRNTNIIMRIAKFLDVHPAYLMFGAIAAPGPAEHKEIGNPATAEQRLAMIAQICAAHWLRALLDTVSASEAADAHLREIAALTRVKPI
jgi:transcriptional regulator with XRE-family HTH domain